MNDLNKLKFGGLTYDLSVIEAICDMAIEGKEGPVIDPQFYGNVKRLVFATREMWADLELNRP